MTDISAKALEERERLRQDIKRSEEMRATLRAKLARGKDQDLIVAWQDIEALDLDIATQHFPQAAAKRHLEQLVQRRVSQIGIDQ